MRRTIRGSAFGNSPNPFRDNSAQPFRDDVAPESDGLLAEPLRLRPVPLSRTLLGRDVGQAPAPHSSRVAIPPIPCPPVWSALWTAMRVPGAKIPLPPGFIPPCLPTPSQKAPSGSAWVHEIKHDGYRLIARRDGNRVRLFTRRGYDWSGKYPRIVEALRSLRVRSIIVDGEAVWAGKDGKSDFDNCIPMPMTTRCSCMRSTCSN